MANITTAEEIRNVVLSDRAKAFLVAHRMIEEAIAMIKEHTEDFLGEGEDEALWKKTGELQDEILSLMKVCIKESLSWSEVTEI